MPDPQFAEPNSFWDWVAKLAVGLGGGVIGYLTSIGQNRLAAKSAEATAKTAAETSAIDGFRKLVEDVQNAHTKTIERLEVAEKKTECLEQRLDQCEEKHHKCEQDRITDAGKIAALEKQVADVRAVQAATTTKG